jgi:hypothetical protein
VVGAGGLISAVVVTVCAGIDEEEVVCSRASDVVSGGLPGGASWDTSLRDVVGWESAGSGILEDVSFEGVVLCVASGGCDCLCIAAMAVLISTGHTDAWTWKGTWASKVRQISIICCGGSSPKYALLRA